MEITFTRQISYSLDVEDADLNPIAKRLGISKKKLITKIEDGDLSAEQEADITVWIEENDGRLDILDTGDIEDMEFHAA